MSINLYLLTFNCGRTLIQPDVFSQYILSANRSDQPAPDLLVLSLQEIAPISYAFLGGSFIAPYFNAFRHAVKLASKGFGYVNVVTKNVGMTAQMVFVREALLPHIRSVQTAGVGFGMSDMGNKGAVGTCLGYTASEGQSIIFTFVAAHLAPMEWAVPARNRDYETLVRRLVFTGERKSIPITTENEESAPLLDDSASGTDEGLGIYSASSYLFVAGDLNYRTSDTAPTPEDATENFPEPTTDLEDPKHYSHLLSKDQLTVNLQQGKTLHGFREAAIQFPPTYKYHRISTKPVIDDDSQTWAWASHRWPSWCDRILYLDPSAPASSANIKVHNYIALPLFNTSDHRPVALSASILLGATDINPVRTENITRSPPFPPDSDWKAKRDTARRKEIIVGLLAYFTTTYEGFGLMTAMTVGALGGWYIIQSLIET